MLCSTTAWDIVLADLRLPGLSGTDLAKAYWQHIGGRSTTALNVSERVARQAQTIFIACSADAGSIDLASCGMHDALCKRAIAPCGRSPPAQNSADGPRCCEQAGLARCVAAHAAKVDASAGRHLRAAHPTRALGRARRRRGVADVADAAHSVRSLFPAPPPASPPPKHTGFRRKRILIVEDCKIALAAMCSAHGANLAPAGGRVV